MESGRSWLTDTLPELATTWGVRVVGVLVVALIAWVLAGWAKKAVVSALGKRRFDITLTKFFGNVLRYAILIGAALGCLGVFGIQTASFAAVIAAMGLAIGFAFQGTLSNFAAGVMLLVFRPFRVGDLITVASVTGVVEEIELFTTELTALDNRKIIVPNGSIFGATIQNLTHHPTRRIEIPVGVAYSANLDDTRRVLEAAAATVPGGLSEPPPQVLLTGLGASSVDYKVRVWCNTADYWKVWENTIRSVKMALDAAQIGIPFPQMDVHHDTAIVHAIRGGQGPAKSERVPVGHAG